MQSTDFDSIVVGAGFAGLYMLHELLQMDHRTLVLEKGAGVGGTWYWNRYPGARCDVASMEYSYQFDDSLQQEWNWSEKFSPQPEILQYANHVADRYDLRVHIKFEHTVVAAEYSEHDNCWIITAKNAQGVSLKFSTTYFIAATGCLSSPNKPQIEGLENFEGDIYHTGEWPHEPVDFSDSNVAIIGTGSSGIQSIPVIANQAKHLTVLQRTANYAVPARNAPLSSDERDRIRANYPQRRREASKTRNGQLTKPNPQSALAVNEQQRIDQYEKRWEEGGLAFIGSFNDLIVNNDSNQTAADFVRSKIAEIVEDPTTAKVLSPKTLIGCKRLCVDSGYYEAFNLSNVSLIDISDTPISSIDATGIVISNKFVDVDKIIFATGYDAMTGSLLKLNVTGRKGVSLSNAWQEGPKSYLGLAIHDFPNFFTITGPGSPSVLTNMLPTIEQHVNLLVTILKHAKTIKSNCIEATQGAQNAWVEHVNDTASQTIFPSCNSWYLGANVPGKPRVFMPYVGFPEYVKRCEDMIANNFEGFELSIQ